MLSKILGWKIVDIFDETRIQHVLAFVTLFCGFGKLVTGIYLPLALLVSVQGSQLLSNSFMRPRLATGEMLD
jgi:hypothetical protein